ncbi:hypothetical protein M885DRAFT_538452 [Pelagophyceae sp. CCMP2097]|nr:hypothetical protein M885DRAFT_538452 [Pelagophyceae sp. CCMP2097]
MRRCGGAAMHALRSGPLRRCASTASQPGAKLFVRNLPRTATEETVRNAFEAVCAVRTVRVPLESGASRGFAFVEVPPSVNVDVVLYQLDGSQLGANFITVTRSESHQDMRRLQNLSNSIALNREVISADSTEDLLDLFVNYGDGFNHVNLATSMHRAGALADGSTALHPKLQVLAGRCVVSLHRDGVQWRGQELANAASGAAKVGIDAPLFFEAVACEALTKVSSFTPQNLASISWALAKARAAGGPHARQLLEAVAAEAVFTISAFKPQEMANTAWAFATAGVAAPALFEAVASAAPTKMAQFKPQELANTVWAFSTSGLASPAAFAAVASAPALFRAVADETRRKMRAFKPQELANLAWAFSTAGLASPALFEAVAAEVAKRMPTFKARELATTAWALSTAGLQEPPRDAFAAAASAAVPQLATFNARGLATTAWAFFRAGVEAPQLFDAIAVQAVAKIDAFDAQGLTNIASAFSTGPPTENSRALFAAIADTAPRRLAAFTAQALANTALAFSVAGVAAPNLFAALAAESSDRIAEFDARALANIVWAFAKAGVPAPRLFDAVARKAKTSLAHFTATDLANVSWAYGEAGYAAPRLLAQVAQEVPRRLGSRAALEKPAQRGQRFAEAFAAAQADWAASPARADWAASQASEAPAKQPAPAFNSQALSNTVWALAKARVSSKALFEAVAAEAPRQITFFSAQALSNTAWAFATAGVDAPQLFDAVAKEALYKLPTCDAQALANTAWAFATAGVDAPALFEAVSLRLDAAPETFAAEHRSQLHLVRLHLASHDASTPLFAGHAEELKAAYLAQGPTPSQAQRNASAALARIGWAHDFEHVTVDGLRLDMTQPLTKLAVEFDGPQHYFFADADDAHSALETPGAVAQRRVLDGPSKFKERLLNNRGWRLARVPFYDWAALETAGDREAYLRRKLEALRPPPLT